MIEIIKDYWNVILSAAVVVVFIVRMEGRTTFHGMELTRLQKQRDADLMQTQRSREETHTMLRDMNSKLDRLIERNLK